MPGDRRQILSLLRLPIPPLQQKLNKALLYNNLCRHKPNRPVALNCPRFSFRLSWFLAPAVQFEDGIQ